MLVICDAMSKTYADERAFVASLCGQLKIVGREEFGWNGFFLLDAAWNAGQMLISVGPGHGDLTPEIVRAFLMDKKRAAA
jgi:hypothetical protein